MIFAFLLLVLCSTLVRQETCDMIELHHMHDAQGKPVFDQIIFWDWSHEDNKYRVRAWRIVDNKERPEKRNGRWYITYSDNQIRRCFVAEHFRESWLQKDPEREDKREHPEHLRTALRR